MSMPRTAALALASLTLIGAAPAGPSPQETVAARQAAFKLSAAAFGGLKRAVDGGADVKTLGFPAGGIASWAKALPGMFPAGTDLANSDALPSVWSDRAGFLKAAAVYSAAADKMVAASKSGDSVAFAAAWGETGAACKACHTSYRKPEPPRG